MYSESDYTYCENKSVAKRSEIKLIRIIINNKMVILGVGILRAFTLFIV
jgi:hypothetical protein